MKKSMKVKTAVILAAGLGSRLKDRTKEMPKGFLEIDGKSLIQRSVEKLLAAGIEHIYFGTGYLTETYEEFTKNYPATCVLNPKFATTGSMFTLWGLGKHLNDDFLLLESDLLYDQSGLDFLINADAENVILASGKTNSGDEVYIQADENKELINMSKNANELENIYGELVGISKVSYKTFLKMCKFAEQKFKTNPKLDYEYAFVGVSTEKPFVIGKIDDFAWCEIDDESHLNRALTQVYPEIKKREEAYRR